MNSQFYSSKLLIVFTFIFILINTAFAAPADFDSTFGTNGKVVTAAGSGFSHILKVIPLVNGKTLAVGSRNNTGSQIVQIAVVRYNANGTIDTTFGSGGQVSTTISGGTEARAVDAAIQPDGKIIVVGGLKNDTRNQSFVVRYNANGTLDTSFSGDGILVYSYNAETSEYATTVIVQPDGKILISSQAIFDILGTAVNGFCVARLNANGSFDTVFGLSGKRVGEFGARTTGKVKIGLQPNGRIIVAGRGGNNSTLDFSAVRLTADGDLDSSFGSQGKIFADVDGDDVMNDLVVLPNGKFIIAGYSGPLTAYYFSMIAYTANGVQDETFGFFGMFTRRFSVYADAVETITAQPDGRIIAAGRTAANILQNDVAVLRLTPNGQPDSTFGDNGAKIFDVNNSHDTTNTVAVQPNGRILIGGSTRTPTDSFMLARLLGRGTIGDFDGDGRSDASVFRPSEGTWYINQTSQGVIEYPFGSGSDRTIVGDFDGDGRGDVAILRPNNYRWYILKSRAGFYSINYGAAGDIPVPADYDGDGKTDIAVFRPANGYWFILRSSDNQTTSIQFGAASDKPMSGDFDGDGRADATVFRPSNGTWYSLGSRKGFSAVNFGAGDDVPITADFDGDSRNDVAVFRPSNGYWYVLRSSDQNVQATAFGMNGDIPQASDFDGDGRADYSVFRASANNWYVWKSSDNAFQGISLGTVGDVPATAVFPR